MLKVDKTTTKKCLRVIHMETLHLEKKKNEKNAW